jgi:hypothetical protein
VRGAHTRLDVGVFGEDWYLGWCACVCKTLTSVSLISITMVKRVVRVRLENVDECESNKHYDGETGVVCAVV